MYGHTDMGWLVPRPQKRSSHSSAAVADCDPRCQQCGPLQTMTIDAYRKHNTQSNTLLTDRNYWAQYKLLIIKNMFFIYMKIQHPIHAHMPRHTAQPSETAGEMRKTNPNLVGVTFQRRWYRNAVQSRSSLAHLQRTKLLKLGDKAIDILDLATTLSWRGFYRTLAQFHEQNSRTTKYTYQ